jgi:putative endonuclease
MINNCLYFVYFLESVNFDFYYVGMTSDLQKRLNAHCIFRFIRTLIPITYIIKAYIAVDNRDTAAKLEKYFKTGSGIAFARKRILHSEALA